MKTIVKVIAISMVAMSTGTAWTQNKKIVTSGELISCLQKIQAFKFYHDDIHAILPDIGSTIRYDMNRGEGLTIYTPQGVLTVSPERGANGCSFRKDDDYNKTLKDELEELLRIGGKKFEKLSKDKESRVFQASDSELAAMLNDCQAAAKEYGFEAKFEPLKANVMKFRPSVAKKMEVISKEAIHKNTH